MKSFNVLNDLSLRVKTRIEIKIKIVETFNKTNIDLNF